MLKGLSLEPSAFDKLVAGDLSKAAVKIAQRRRSGKVGVALPLSVSTIEMLDRIIQRYDLPGRPQAVDVAVYALTKALVVQERRDRLRRARQRPVDPTP